MKKLLCLILSLTMLLGLVACDFNNSETTISTSTTTESSTQTDSTTTNGMKLLKEGSITAIEITILNIRGRYGKITLTEEDIQSFLTWLESVEITSNETKFQLCYGCGATIYVHYEDGEIFRLSYSTDMYSTQFSYGDFPYTANDIKSNPDKVLSDFCDMLEDLGVDFDALETYNFQM